MNAPRKKGKGHPRGGRPPAKSGDVGWDAVAAWYDRLVGDAGHDYHRHVIVPTVMRMAGVRVGESVADVCCGQGVMVGPMLEAGASRVFGVDASSRLVEAARRRFGGEPRARFAVADASAPGAWADGSHDLAVCVMAVHDVAGYDGLFRNIAYSLRPGGRFVIIQMHPCFRIPKRTHWGFDNGQMIQFRRVDAYAREDSIPVTTHPGKDSGEETVFHHRPLAAIIQSLGRAGLAVTGCEEPISHRRSQAGGPFSRAEHRAAEEIPVFLALSGVKVTG